MKSFLIQVKDNVLCHDFGFTLIESIKYNNWYYNEIKYIYHLSNSISEYDFTEFIPIGSVEFVQNFLKKYYDIDGIKPINIPKELMKSEYLKRWVQLKKTDNITFNTGDTSIFVKDSNKIKGYVNIIPPNRGYPAGNWLVSEVVDIKSEWRTFVHNKELVGLQNYSGDFTMFPDVKLIQDMINGYKDSPPCYTLDVGINKKDETFLIECGNFFSSGLYGFADHRILPRMYIDDFNYIIKKNQ